MEKTPISHFQSLFHNKTKIIFGSTVILPYMYGIFQSTYILKAQVLMKTRFKELQRSMEKGIQWK